MDPAFVLSTPCFPRSAAPTGSGIGVTTPTARASSPLSNAAVAAAAAAMLALPSMPAVAMKLPPIDRTIPDRVRCTPKSSAIGQANAARDSLLDLRECDLRNQDLRGFDLSGAILENATLDGSKFEDAMLSKVYAPKASFKDCDFTNAVADRALFNGSDFTGAVFANAVLSDSTFEGADLKDTDWSDVYIGDFAQKAICRNETLGGTNGNGEPSRESLGCR